LLVPSKEPTKTTKQLFSFDSQLFMGILIAHYARLKKVFGTKQVENWWISPINRSIAGRSYLQLGKLFGSYFKRRYLRRETTMYLLQCI